MAQHKKTMLHKMVVSNKSLLKLAIILYSALNLSVFCISYFAIKPFAILMDMSTFICLNILLSVILATRIQASTLKKFLFIMFASMANTLIGFLLVSSTMFIPGSKEHNYVMYNICLPEMKKHYGIKENQGFPDDGKHDKDGLGKWWYQHKECEQNVMKGKGPIFSENPVDFVPVNE